MSFILGLNTHHPDSSACILENGVLLAATEEERFNRIKHWSGLPIQSIDYCLTHAKIKFSDLDYIAINTNPYNILFLKLILFFTFRTNPVVILKKLLFKSKKINLINTIQKNFPIDKFHGKLINVDHHLSHLSSVYYYSNYEKSVVLSVDGFGDLASTAWGFAKYNKIDIDKKIFFPHSLGIFYQAITQFLGFNNYGDEYKVMGLSSYGDPIYIEEMKKIISLKSDGSFKLNLFYFRHHQNKIDFTKEDGIPIYDNLYSNNLIKLLGEPRKKSDAITERHKNIAASVQLMYENTLFNILNSIYIKYNCQNLCLSGGCAMNSVANGKIRLKTSFQNVFIQPASGDSGGSVGAAVHTWHSFQKSADSKISLDNKLNIAYLGPSYTNDEIFKELTINKEILINKKIAYSHHHMDDYFFNYVSEQISRGMVVGWFQERMEWGPRALGNRSILGDPRRADMQEILNLKIKRRESFRPFAPSILKEYMNEWFEQSDDVPYMSQVYQIKTDKRKLIPAVCHVDGTGRVQTVTELNNDRYYKLINAFNKITGVPILLNTSFNENEPIVCNPKEALNCFIRTNMDILVMENWIIKRITS